MRAMNKARASTYGPPEIARAYKGRQLPGTGYLELAMDRRQEKFRCSALTLNQLNFATPAKL